MSFGPRVFVDCKLRGSFPCSLRVFVVFLFFHASTITTIWTCFLVWFCHSPFGHSFFVIGEIVLFCWFSCAGLLLLFVGCYYYYYYYVVVVVVICGLLCCCCYLWVVMLLLLFVGCYVVVVVDVVVVVFCCCFVVVLLLFCCGFVVLVVYFVTVGMIVLQLFLFWFLHCVLLVLASCFHVSVSFYVLVSCVSFRHSSRFQVLLLSLSWSHHKSQDTRQCKREGWWEDMMQVGDHNLWKSKGASAHTPPSGLGLRKIFWKCWCWGINLAESKPILHREVLKDVFLQGYWTTWSRLCWWHSAQNRS